MEQRICYGKNTPVTFLENRHFSRECPYRVRKKDFQNDDIAPLHYADTLELGVCCGIQGEVIIRNERLMVDGEAVYAVPPGAVHATSFSRGTGCIYVLQISPEALKERLPGHELFHPDLPENAGLYAKAVCTQLQALCAMTGLLRETPATKKTKPGSRGESGFGAL